MIFSHQYRLPKGETPLSQVTVIVTQSGRIHIASHEMMGMPDVAALLAAGIQVAMTVKKEQVKEEASRIVRPDLVEIPKRPEN